MEREAPQNFDLLILDAFSGDAVPTHLLTKEAFDIYGRHLREGAKVAVNISNRYLDLAPVVAGLADCYGYTRPELKSPGDPALGQFPADWIVFTPRRQGAYSRCALPRTNRWNLRRAQLLWTDDHSNLFEILKWQRG